MPNRLLDKPLNVTSLTGLRGVAAVFVIGFHCHTILPSHPLPAFPFAFGYLGVDVFFVLSGFILASLNSALTPSSGGAFLMRRLFRIFPLHLSIMFAIAIAVGIAASRGFNVGDHYQAKTFLPVALLLHVPFEIYGWNDPTWSISVEMACYISLPLLLPLTRMVSVRICVLIISGALLFDAALHALIILIDDEAVLPVLTGWCPFARGFIGFYAGCFLARLFDMGGCDLNVFWAPFKWKPIYWLGEISFSLYLIHQPLLSIGKRADPFLATRHLSWLLLPSFAFIVVGLSCLTYVTIEKPARRIPTYLSTRKRRNALNAAYLTQIGGR
jgi:peptidoglycan/LPS O-acetylase OafA/YrhL